MPGDDESMNDEAIWETLPVSFISLVHKPSKGWQILFISHDSKVIKSKVLI